MERGSLTVVTQTSDTTFLRPDIVRDWLQEKHGKFRVCPGMCELVYWQC